MKTVVYGRIRDHLPNNFLKSLLALLAPHPHLKKKKSGAIKYFFCQT